jgi:hypothetical protein
MTGLPYRQNPVLGCLRLYNSRIDEGGLEGQHTQGVSTEHGVQHECC